MTETSTVKATVNASASPLGVSSGGIGEWIGTGAKKDSADITHSSGKLESILFMEKKKMPLADITHFEDGKLESGRIFIEKKKFPEQIEEIIETLTENESIFHTKEYQYGVGGVKYDSDTKLLTIEAAIYFGAPEQLMSRLLIDKQSMWKRAIRAKCIDHIKFIGFSPCVDTMAWLYDNDVDFSVCRWRG